MLRVEPRWDEGSLFARTPPQTRDGYAGPVDERLKCGDHSFSGGRIVGFAQVMCVGEANTSRSSRKVILPVFRAEPC